ncbi:MAG: thioredoxin family protein [Candidatus Aenigmatarchaeota archaeon]
MKTYNAGNFSEAFQTRKLVIACFYMETCPFCRKFLPIFEKQNGMTGMEFVKVDITDENSPLWDEYKIQHVPSVIVFRNGRPLIQMDARPNVGLREQDIYGLLSRVMAKEVMQPRQ